MKASQLCAELLKCRLNKDGDDRLEAQDADQRLGDEGGRRRRARHSIGPAVQLRPRQKKRRRPRPQERRSWTIFARYNASRVPAALAAPSFAADIRSLRRPDSAAEAVTYEGQDPENAKNDSQIPREHSREHPRPRRHVRRAADREAEHALEHTRGYLCEHSLRRYAREHCDSRSRCPRRR